MQTVFYVLVKLRRGHNCNQHLAVSCLVVSAVELWWTIVVKIWVNDILLTAFLRDCRDCEGGTKLIVVGRLIGLRFMRKEVDR